MQEVSNAEYEMKKSKTRAAPMAAKTRKVQAEVAAASERARVDEQELVGQGTQLRAWREHGQHDKACDAFVYG